MSLRIIEISAPDKASDKIQELAEKNEAIDWWYNAKNKDGRRTTSILVDVNNQQDLLDALQRTVTKEEGWRIVLIPVEATIPKPDPDEEAKKGKNGHKMLSGSITREELYDDMIKGARLDLDFIVLVILSTIVAGIGLVESNIAVIIGAMVIAPLLGPNLALAFGAALGDIKMIFNAVKTNAAGVGITLLVSFIAGLFLPYDMLSESAELMSRTNANFAGIVLALASGAAAVLSVTTGLSSALVGVMVAVALMPPAVALGLTLGTMHLDTAYGAALLLATNVVCINLAAQAVFLFKGIRPRTWYEEKQAKKARKMNMTVWLVLLILLAGLIALKHYLSPDA